MNSHTLWMAVFVIRLGLVPEVPGAQITLTPVADTALWQRESWKNAGGSDLLPAGATSSDGDTTKARILVRFDPAAALPPGALIESAVLFLTVVRAPSLPAEKPISGSTFALHRVLQSWGEGNKTYTSPSSPMQTLEAATEGEATWLYRHFGDETKRWLVPGGDLTDGDFAEAASATFYVGSGSGGEYPIALGPTALQDLREWAAGTAPDHGWVLKSQSETTTGTARLFGSREHFDPLKRPRLVVNYSIPEPAPPYIQTIQLSGSAVAIRFSALAGIIYRPQFRGEEVAGAWTDLPDLGPLSADGSIEFSREVTAASSGFFRITVP